MSMHSSETPSHDGPDTGSVFDDAVREAYLEELREGRVDNSGGWAQVRSDESPGVREAEIVPGQGAVIDPDREVLGDGTRPTEEERAVMHERLPAVRAILAEVSGRVGTRAVTAAELSTRTSQEVVSESHSGEVDEREERRNLHQEARRLAIETGVTHRVIRNAQGKLAVEPLSPRTKNRIQK